MNLTDSEKRFYSEAAARGVKLTPSVALQFQITEDTKMEYNVKTLLAQPKQTFAELRSYLLALANYDLTNEDCRIMSGEGRKAFREAAYTWLENYANREESDPIAPFVFNKEVYFTSNEHVPTALGQAIEAASSSTSAETPSAVPEDNNASLLSAIRAEVEQHESEDIQAFAEEITGGVVEPDEAVDTVVKYVFNQHSAGIDVDVSELAHHLFGDNEEDDDQEFDRNASIDLLIDLGVISEEDRDDPDLDDDTLRQLLDQDEDDSDDDEDPEDFDEDNGDDDDSIMEALSSGNYISGALPDLLQMRHTARVVLLLDLSRIPMSKEDTQSLRGILLEDGTECNFVSTLNPGNSAATGYAYNGLGAVLQAMSTLNEANNHIICDVKSIAHIHNAIASNMSNILERAFIELSGIADIESVEDSELVNELNERTPLYNFEVVPSLLDTGLPELESIVFLTLPVPSISTSDTLNRLISIINEMVQEFSSIEVDIYATVNADSILKGGDKLRTLLQSVNMLSKRELLEHIEANVFTSNEDEDEDEVDDEDLELYDDSEFKMPGNSVNTQLYVPYLLPNDCSHVAYLASVSSYEDEDDSEDSDFDEDDDSELYEESDDPDFDEE